ncbi:MAG: oxygen-independent coproporphyrinogen III oxidase [Candidatus Eisenbacteria bacterium]|nr:oxygen-independent coproporphyrinogen III oxidase [Candidatus Eisenbacteria bacterium]
MDASLRVTPELLKKYDRPGPRYTSYPTAVEFNEGYNHDLYLASLEEAATRVNDPLSLYIHLPFCEERCSFCGCHVIITKKRGIAQEYLGYLHREIREVARLLGARNKVVQYHWGGGTPTYQSPEEMRALHAVVAEHFDIQPGAEVAIEVDPRVTTREQVDLLRELGWNRLSMGVQDFTPDVQEAINRHQTEDETRALYTYARSVGFGSINLDLIYGLPLQSQEAFRHTLAVTLELRPDRVALYSYAYVPWIKGNQKKLDVEQLPDAEAKMELFCLAREEFLKAGYRPVGMDHFALPEDELSTAIESRTLHRNFMGYTVKNAPDMIGVGVSAIGDVSSCYAQNAKKLSVYYQEIDGGRLPVERGYRLSADDLLRRHVITQLMCNFYLDLPAVERRFGVNFAEYFARELAELQQADGPVDHGFLSVQPTSLEVLPLGRLFVRNLAMVFDRYMREKEANKQVFSRTV